MVLVIDVSAVETKAAEECRWASGWQGDGLPPAEFAMRVVWCMWHLYMAWVRNVEEHVSHPSVRKRIKEMLLGFLRGGVAVRVPAAPVR